MIRVCHWNSWHLFCLASKELAQTSYFMATNSLHLTTMCLRYSPTIVACVCIHLACIWSKYQIPVSGEVGFLFTLIILWEHTCSMFATEITFCSVNMWFCWILTVCSLIGDWILKLVCKLLIVLLFPPQPVFIWN